MAVISGVAGAVNGRSSVREWTVTGTEALNEFAGSNTNAGTGQAAGIKDWTGSYQAYGHTPSVMPGETFVFTGSTEGTLGGTGTARVKSVQIRINHETAEPISHTVNFEGTTVFTRGAAVAADASMPDIHPPISIADVELGTMVGAPAWTAIANWRTCDITLETSNPSYADSDSAGQMNRVRGKLTASISVALFMSDPSAVPAEGTAHRIRIKVATGTAPAGCWLFHFVRVRNSPVNVPIESGEKVDGTIEFAWSAYDLVDSAMTEGVIKNPAETTYWPFA